MRRTNPSLQCQIILAKGVKPEAGTKEVSLRHDGRVAEG